MEDLTILSSHGSHEIIDFSSCHHLHVFVLLADDERHASYWNNKGRQALHTALNIQPNLHRAKNLILFLGDGESFLH